MKQVKEIIGKMGIPINIPVANTQVLSKETPKCLRCNDCGWVYEDGTARAVSCVCQLELIQKRLADNMLKFCKLPKASEGLTFSSFKKRPYTETAYKYACELADNKPPYWLTLIGAVDTGKTHLAIAICRRWLEQGRVARYVYVPLLLEELREGYKDDGREYSVILNHFLKVPLLILDDLGVEKPSAWVQEKLQTIIDYRYMNRLPLVVTTNKPITELPGDDEGRIASRLTRFEPSAVVEIAAPEYNLYKRQIVKSS